jgi:hypothetical protein
MAKEKRESRKNPDFDDLNKLKPIDLSILGTDDDPCFGKLYNLSEDECQRCGDSEFCAIKMAQTQKVKRTEIESTQRFLDIEEEGGKDIDDVTDSLTVVRKVIRRKIRLGKTYIEIQSSINKKYPHISSKQIKQLYNHLKK